jgi:hypothetical protein
LAADLAIPPEQNEAATPKGETTIDGRRLLPDDRILPFYVSLITLYFLRVLLFSTT